MPVCEVQDSYHASYPSDASIGMAACNHEEDISISLLFVDMDVLISNSSDNRDSNS